MYCLTACEGRVAWSFTGTRAPVGAGATGGGRDGRRDLMGRLRRWGGPLMVGRCWSPTLHSACSGPTVPIWRGQCPKKHVTVQCIRHPHPHPISRGGAAHARDADRCSESGIRHVVGGQLSPTAIRGVVITMIVRGASSKHASLCMDLLLWSRYSLTRGEHVRNYFPTVLPQHSFVLQRQSGRTWDSSGLQLL